MTNPELRTSAATPQPAAAGAPGGSAVQAEPGAEVSKARRVTFRVLATVTSLWVGLVVIFGLTEVVLMWLPAETLASMIDFPPEDVVHRAHFMAIGINSWALLLGVLAQLRQPARREAPMLHVLVLVVAASVVHALSGTVGAWLVKELTLLAPVLALAMLHPRARALFRRPVWDGAMGGLAAVAAVPWLWFAFTHLRLQARGTAGDVHVEPEHWATAAIMALLLVACALIGATERSGWRLTAWIAAVGPVLYGTHSLVFPDPLSALSTPWAVAAVAWGVAYAVLIVRRGRLASRTPATS